MSEKDEKREQANKLLRSFTDIDDRYLAEAMEEPENTKTGGRKANKYSRWALTAAACLMVVLLGRFAVLQQEKNAISEKSETISVMQSETGIDTAASGEVSSVSEDMAAEDSAMQEDASMEAAQEAVPEDAAMEDSVMQEDVAMEAAQEAVPEDAAMEDMAMEAEEEAKNSPDAAGESAAQAAGEAYESAQIANPFIDTQTLDEAEEIAGFECSVPGAVRPYTTVTYRAVRDEMLEIIFYEKEDTEGYRIRKAIGNEDISGDYSEYEEEKTISLDDGTKVTLRGDRDNCWSAAVWTKSGEAAGTEYSYAICAGEKTFTTDEIRDMARVMTKQ